MAYYQTQITKVGSGYAVDTFGKRLKFIGNYPCQAGDFVWTDGNVIFGNVSVKPQPILFEEDDGKVPVVFSDDEGNEKICGFVDSSGNFKEYDVAADSWIVNDRTQFKHGEGDFLDVEISRKGDIFTAEFHKDDKLRILIKKNGNLVATLDFRDFGHNADSFHDGDYRPHVTVELDLFKFHDREGHWTAFLTRETSQTEITEYSILTEDFVIASDGSSSTTQLESYDGGDMDEYARSIAKSIEDAGINYTMVTGSEDMDALVEWVKRTNINYILENFFYNLFRPHEVYLDVGVVNRWIEKRTIGVASGQSFKTTGSKEKFVVVDNNVTETYYTHSAMNDDGRTSGLSTYELYEGEPPRGYSARYVGETGQETYWRLYYVNGVQIIVDIADGSNFSSSGKFYEVRTSDGGSYHPNRTETTSSKPVKVPIQDGFYYITGKNAAIYDSEDKVIYKYPVGEDVSTLDKKTICKLKQNSYLLGGKGGWGLAKIQNGVMTQIDLELDRPFGKYYYQRNFRLRKLNHISKARR